MLLAPGIKLITSAQLTFKHKHWHTRMHTHPPSHTHTHTVDLKENFNGRSNDCPCSDLSLTASEKCIQQFSSLARAATAIRGCGCRQSLLVSGEVTLLLWLIFHLTNMPRTIYMVFGHRNTEFFTLLLGLVSLGFFWVSLSWQHQLT